MPVNASILESIQAIRDCIATPVIDEKQVGLSTYVYRLFLESVEIVQNPETLAAILAIAPEIEAYRGKGSQAAARRFSEEIGNLIFRLQYLNPPCQQASLQMGSEDEEQDALRINASALDCYELLSSHVFARTQGPRVRSSHAVNLRESAWDSLGQITEIFRRPEHLAHAMKVAADARASDGERIAAVKFLTEYWSGDICDEATDRFLINLSKNSPNRRFLVSVLRARIDLDLESEHGAMRALDDWDDSNDEESLKD